MAVRAVVPDGTLTYDMTMGDQLDGDGLVRYHPASVFLAREDPEQRGPVRLVKLSNDVSDPTTVPATRGSQERCFGQAHL